MYHPFSWLRIAFSLTAYLVLFAIVGLILDEMALTLCLGILALLLNNYWQLYRLNRWLWHSRKMSPPSVKGMWEHVYEGVYFLQRRNRNKRKELGTLVTRFRDGAEALPDAAVVIDVRGTITWCNRLARIELGFKWPADAGQRLNNLIRNPKFINYFHEGDFTFPIEVASPVNPNKILEYRIMPYGEDHLLLIARDVTRLSQLEEMRKDFVANVSHELRTPLTVITGYLELMDNGGNDNPMMSKAISEMEAQSRRMKNLIEDLLVLSRIEASAERIHDRIVHMPTMLKQIEVEAQTLNKNKAHSINFHIESNLNVYGIETELRSACSNLIFNAINYTPEKGVIDVYWERVQSGVKFSVVDNGEGIEQAHLSRLTERFYRVDKARSRSTGGSGLGLSIVKHVLSHHNAKLEIKSKVGEGSEFSFKLADELVVENEKD
ncbi:phosphate regulon sensor histidine kinase PhoR [Alteromonas sp. ASW11-130]|uniref:phosphate regulon sensor histidine kinase PhoR n=1 Tax=Alteromonas sp. ASW11-130 TaxID=3015775 RepID=UPI00224233DB|nr:phosphate regulon sensor histidine kinase PhoR [Alteromonas sp. ASW11-130]MCW8090494.1 phosphate regulon sensor histidine kinase PhoR [Alteromonas sp. ASW11-130]